RHQRRTDFGAHRRLTFLLRPSGFEDLRVSPRKPIPQHGMVGTPPGRLHRSHGDEVAVERGGSSGDTIPFSHSALNNQLSTLNFPFLFPILTSSFLLFLLFSALRWHPQKNSRATISTRS